MGDRRIIQLDENPVVAAAQALSWIAFPHRPQHGVSLLNQWFWARKRSRGESIPDLPFQLKKKNVIESQLGNFAQKVREGMRAGHWFQMQLLTDIDTGDRLSVSTRMLSQNFAESFQSRHYGGKDQGSVTRSIWSKRKEVLHLASAIHRAQAYHHEGKPPEHLEQAVFAPIWLDDALYNAERYVTRAEYLGVFKPDGFFHFQRDSF